MPPLLALRTPPPEAAGRGGELHDRARLAQRPLVLRVEGPEGAIWRVLVGLRGHHLRGRVAVGTQAC
eukprot:1181932-Prorocentrum_minimum.AAC.2